MSWEEFTKGYRLGEGESYGLPYWTLVPKGIDNLLVLGRCISTDRGVQGSIRGMPCCLITGMPRVPLPRCAANETAHHGTWMQVCCAAR